MTEEQGDYITDTKEAMEMLGAGYEDVNAGYIIIEAGYGCQKLSKIVNEHLRNGWLLIGGPFVVPVSHSNLHDGANHAISTKVCQAMVRHLTEKATAKQDP